MASEYWWLVRVGVDLLSLFLVYLPWIILNAGDGMEPFHRGFFCDDDSLKHPYKDSTIPSPVLVSVSLLLPSLLILVTEGVHVYVDKKNGHKHQPYSLGRWSVHSYFIACYKLIGVFLFGLAAQQTITNIAKYSVGRLRPHFFDVCKPNYTAFNCFNDQGFYRYVEEDVCTTTDAHRLKEMRLSFPSGHASMSCYSMTFIVLYLQVRLTWKGSKLLKPFLQAAALYLALLTCVSRISDYKHHWSDVLLGALMGVLVALLVGMYLSSLFKQPSVQDLLRQITELCTGPAGPSGDDASRPRDNSSLDSFGLNDSARPRNRTDYIPA